MPPDGGLEGGSMAVPTGPGLGVEPDRVALAAAYHAVRAATPSPPSHRMVDAGHEDALGGAMGVDHQDARNKTAGAGWSGAERRLLPVCCCDGAGLPVADARSRPARRDRGAARNRARRRGGWRCSPMPTRGRPARRARSPAP
nr:hypothetical protein GCM10020063_045000 [Dactylosporangium thailandense]